jgi:hypothetical protein
VARATFTAALTGPEAARVQLALGSLLGKADELLADRALVGRILTTAAGAPRYPLPGATREELLAAIAADSHPVDHEVSAGRNRYRLAITS